MVIINGHWGHWSSWSVCSLSCGGGTRVRTRFCNNPLPSDLGRACPQETFSKHWTPPIFLVKAKDVEKCNMHACPGEYNLYVYSSYESNWQQLKRERDHFKYRSSKCGRQKQYLHSMGAGEVRKWQNSKTSRKSRKLSPSEKHTYSCRGPYVPL